MKISHWNFPQDAFLNFFWPHMLKHFCLKFYWKFWTTCTTSSELRRDQRYHFHASSQTLSGISKPVDKQFAAKWRILTFFFLFVSLVSAALTVSVGVCIAFTHPSALWFIRSRRYFLKKKKRVKKGKKKTCWHFSASYPDCCWRVVKADRKTFLTFYNGFLRRLGHFLFWTNKISNNLKPYHREPGHHHKDQRGWEGHSQLSTVAKECWTLVVSLAHLGLSSAQISCA